MPDAKLFRIAGWCALLSVLLLVGAIFSFAIAEWVGVGFEYASLLALLVVLYALYVVHRRDSAALSLVGLILLPVALVADAVSGANYGNATLVNIWYLTFSLPFLVFGFVIFRSARMPRGVAVLALLVGFVYLVAGAGGFLQGADFADSVSALALLPMVVWLVWLGRVLLSGRLAAPGRVALAA